MKYLLALVALLFAVNVHGATYYFSDCIDGVSHIDCVAGSDTNDGLSPSFPFKSFTKSLPTGVHTRLYAKGGAWALTGTTNFFMPLGTAANPNVWDTYTPSWGPGTAKPIVVFAADVNNKAGFSFNDGTAPTHDEGYTMRGLELRGPGYRADGRTVAGVGNAGFAFSIANDADHILLDNLTISGFVIAVSLSGTSLTYTPDPGANHKNEYITLRNSDIFNNSGQGWLGGGWHVLVENNRFENNGFARDTFDHNIYISTSNFNSGLDASGKTIPWGGAHMVFRGNYMTKSNFNLGTCNATSFVGHYNAYDVVIENNTVYEPAAKSGCYGIQMNVFTSSKPDRVYNHAGTIIRGNRVVMGGGGLGISANGCLNCLVENNVVVRTGSADFLGIAVPEYNALAPNGLDGNAIVRNNSIYIDSPTANTYGMRAHNSVSSGESYVNNLIYFGPSSSVGSKCFSITNSTATRTAASFNAFDKNICHRVGGANAWNDVHSSLSGVGSAQAAGFDLNSSTADPLLAEAPSLANNYSMQVLTGSPAINAGHPTLSSRRAIDSKVPIGARDIGAHDFGATAVAPATPTRLQIN